MSPLVNPSARRRPSGLPRDCVFSLQKAAGAVELLASLVPEGLSEKRMSKFVEVVHHPIKPWIAAIEPKGCIVVWNYETSETVAEFSLEVAQGVDDDVDEGDGAATGTDAGAVAGAAAVAGISSPTASKGFLQLGSASPTAASYMKSSRKSPGLKMLFYDQEALAATAQILGPRACFDEWLIILSTSGITVFDLNHNSMIRRIMPDELQKQIPTSAELLPFGMLAVGFQDGKVRAMNPRVGKITETMDTGSTRDVQQLTLISTPPLAMSRSASGSRSTSTPDADTPSGMYAQRQFLACATLDGRVLVWRLNNTGPDGAEFVKISDMEIRDAFKGFDVSAGVTELRYQASQEMLTVSTRDGGIFIFDATPLVTQSKPLNFVGVLPPNKFQPATVLPGIRKGLVTALSVSPSSTAVTIAEVGPKGRYVGKDNIPTSFLEFFAPSVFESRDQRSFVPANLQKKFKVLSISSSIRSRGEVCCLSSYGLFVLNVRLGIFSRPKFIMRGPEKTPLIAYPGPLKIALRLHGEDTSLKQEDHKLQCNLDTPQERLVPPLLQSCPTNSSLMSALVPASSHFEIVQMDSELRNQKSIHMHTIFSGNAAAIAWHPLKQRFAVLVPQDQSSRRLTRAASTTATAPKRRGFMFGGSIRGMSNDDPGNTSAGDAKQRKAAARAMTLSIYDITSDGHVELVGENCATAEDQVLHIFSGPFLCVVRYIVDESRETNSSAAASDMKSDLHDSSSRTKRSESISIGSILSPTSAGGGSSMSPFSSPSQSPSTLPVDHDDVTSDVKKTFLEFYEWNTIAKDPEISSAKIGLESTLKRVGSASGGNLSSIESPLFLEWERVANQFCALAYTDSIHIYRVTAAPQREVACLHCIPVAGPVLSMFWFHQMLFFTTEDELKCCFLSKSRYFVLDLASRLVPFDASWRSLQTGNSTFPEPQMLPAGATTILGIVNQQLVLSGEMQLVHTISLSNQVFQCCMLIAIGQADLAADAAAALEPEVSEWVGAVFEAFGFTTQYLQLQHVTVEAKINVCIKHNMCDDLVKLLALVAEDSPETLGTSSFQRGCTALFRAGRLQNVEELFSAAIAASRDNDALFIASLIKDDQKLDQALRAKCDWSAAFHLAKKKRGSSAGGPDEDALAKWNDSIALPTAKWRSALDSQCLRAPEILTLTSPAFGAFK